MKTPVSYLIWNVLHLQYGRLRMETFRNLSAQERQECLDLRRLCHSISINHTVGGI